MRILFAEWLFAGVGEGDRGSRLPEASRVANVEEGPSQANKTSLSRGGNEEQERWRQQQTTRSQPPSTPLAGKLVACRGVTSRYIRLRRSFPWRGDFHRSHYCLFSTPLSSDGNDKHGNIADRHPVPLPQPAPSGRTVQPVQLSRVRSQTYQGRFSRTQDGNGSSADTGPCQ